MARIGSSLPPTPPPSSRFGGRIGGPGAAPTPKGPAPAIVYEAGTLPQRLAEATQKGALTSVPPAYEDGQDWETLLSDDVFARLYLAAAEHTNITDNQVQANHAVLAGFWRLKFNSLITGNKDIEERYRHGTVNKAEERLEAAATSLADATGRAACFAELNKRRCEKASVEMGVYMRPLLANSVMSPSAIKVALGAGEERGFTLQEAESYLLASLRQAGFAPVKTVNQSPNLLLATWTPGGTPLTGQALTKVMGHDVYSLAEAGQVLYDALVSDDEKATRNLDTAEYLSSIVQDLKEHDALMDLREILRSKKLNATQKRLSVLYLFGPGLPFYCEEMTTSFASPTEMLTRTSESARDFTAAELSFKAGLLQIWLHAAATAEVKAVIPSTHTALDFRNFLHAAVPEFPLWMGENSFAVPSQLAGYIRHDENTWKRVYGSLEAGYLSPWLQAQGKASILDQQAKLATALIGRADANTDKGRKLSVQALLQALDPKAATPDLQPDVTELALTGLSGEESVQRTLTLTNPNGGYQSVFLALEPALEGVSLSATSLFFDQRAPGQKLTVTLTGNAAAMPRDGQHKASLKVRSAYREIEVPVTGEAVFPMLAFAKFVGGAALALAVIFGAIRFIIGLAVGESSYQAMIDRGTFLPFESASQAGNGNGFIFLLGLLALVGLSYAFIRVLGKLSKSKYAA